MVIGNQLRGASTKMIGKKVTNEAKYGHRAQKVANIFWLEKVISLKLLSPHLKDDY